MTTLLHEGSFDGIIFDCDGTLVDTAPAHLRALRVGLAEHGLAMTDEFYYPRVGITAEALFNEFEEQVVGAAVPRERILALYRTAFQGSLHQLEEVTVVAEIARAWKGRVPMSVGSNGSRSVVEATLTATGLLPLFDFVIVAADVPVGKPAPDLFLEAARRMKVVPARCVVFEDTDEGLEAAHRAGMDGRDVREVFKPSWRLASTGKQ